MRNIIVGAAITAALAAQPAMAQNFMAELSPSDPKYNSAECKAARAKPYDGLNSGQMLALSMVSGFAAGMAERKHDMYQRQLEVACMSKPPARPMFEDNWTATKD